MIDDDPSTWCRTEFRHLLDRQFGDQHHCRIALVADGLTVDDVLAEILASPFAATPLQVVYPTTPLPKIEEPLFLLFWNCSNRDDLSHFLVEAAPVHGLVLVEDSAHLQASAEAPNTELAQITKTWMRIQLHSRLIAAPTISAAHGGVLPVSRVAGALLAHLAR